MFRPGTTLPVFPTRYGPIGVQICYDFWFNPELTRILALKGARLVVNCCATFQGEGKRDYMVHTTRTRAQENLIYTASANLLGGPGHQDYSAQHLDDERAADYLGHSTIAGPAFPRFSHVYAEAGDSEEIVSADPQLREAPPLAVDLPDARLARRPSARRVASHRRRIHEARQPVSAATPSMCHCGVAETPRTTLAPDGGPDCAR